MYLLENILLYEEQREGTDKSKLEPHFADTHFELLQTIILSRQNAHIYFFFH